MDGTLTKSYDEDSPQPATPGPRRCVNGGQHHEPHGGSLMSFDDVRARLNLFAVLPNLEDVVRDDPEMHALVADARITVRLTVVNGPGADVRFAGGTCSVGPPESVAVRTALPLDIASRVTKP